MRYYLLLVCCLASFIHCHYHINDQDVHRGNEKDANLKLQKVVQITENPRPTQLLKYIQNTKKSSSETYASRLRYQSHGQSAIPNISLSLTAGNYYMKFKNVPMNPLMIRRAPIATIGEPWPLPQKYEVNENIVFRISEPLNIKIRNNTCDVLESAVKRFEDTVFRFALEEYYTNLVHIEGSGFESLDKKYQHSKYTKPVNLTTFHIYVNSECSKYPKLESDESYSLLIKNFGIVLMSDEVWGALRGLETLSQVIFTWKDQYFVRDTLIRDFPRFKHRGVLVDSARHFMTKDVIYNVLDGMFQNKMNVLHWHLVDDQSFPYQSKIFPDLSGKGAQHPLLTYNHEDIADIVEYARLRGVRVIPEFDTPGHVYSWGFGYPDILTQCYTNSRKVQGYYGPLNPARNSTFAFLKKLFTEVMDVFPEKVLHLGGDEVPLECWVTNPEVSALLNRLNRITTPSYGDVMKPVWEWYTNRFINILKDIRQSRNEAGQYILWEEASKNNLNIAKDAIIQIWLGGGREILKALDQGYRVLFSSCWYLDHSKYGIHWTDYYLCDPTHHNIKYQPSLINDLKRREDKILGGEVCLWSEYITSESLMSVMWPRASAAAERLWSSSSVVSIQSAGRRLQEHRCRMLRRGLQVGHINGPDYCLLPKHRNDFKNKNIKKRSADKMEEMNLQYRTSLVFKKINNLEPFLIGLVFSISGALFILLLTCLKFKSRVFVICWTFK
ncbi:beta-hexosaminidase subunit beta-like [Mytilus trossulus]|uniref:beta-hexosaminidase subunit beta-like n=1 Tax=Mytilus trossulus TaxID=6551 RepID=UPI0030043912